MASNCHQKVAEPLRILLIGRTGDGKSSTGNTVLGNESFETSSYAKSKTKTSELKRSEWEGRPVEVVDTPGIFDSDNDHTHVRVLKELLRALLITTPGFHVIAFVLKPGRFTPEVQSTLDTFFEWFGTGVENHAFVILTYTDSDENMKLYLENDPHEMLTTLVTKCQNRVVCLDNNGPSEIKKTQLRNLFRMVDDIVAYNKGQCFTNIAYKLAELYANGKEGSFSKDSMILLKTAGLPWALKYCQEAENTLLHRDIEDNKTDVPDTTQAKGNLTIIDEHGKRLQNTIPQSKKISTRSKSFAHNDEVDGRSERPYLRRAVSNAGATLSSMPVVDRDGTNSQPLSNMRFKSTENSTTVEKKKVRRSDRKVDINSVRVNVRDDVDDYRLMQRHDRNVDLNSVRVNEGDDVDVDGEMHTSDRNVNMRVGGDGAKKVRRSDRIIDMNSVCVNVDDACDADGQTSYIPPEIHTTSTTFDQCRDFRQRVNDNEQETTTFMETIKNLLQNLKSKCTLL